MTDDRKGVRHTPAKWLCDGRTVYALHGMPERNRFFCQVQAGRIDDAGIEELQANARLIAAAPDLLEALSPIARFPIEDFAAYDDCADMRVIFKANDWSFTVGDVRRARAAIAKATGAAE